MIVYKLDKQINSQKILKDIQNLVQKFIQQEPNKIPILIIDIKTVTTEDINLIPKIEYKDCIT